MKKKYLTWLLPIVLMTILAPFTPWLDLNISKFFYNPNNPLLERFSRGPIFDFLFNYGVIPGWILFIGATILFLLSYVLKRFKNWRSPSLVLILTFIMGAGFFTHLILKDHWGRPRPKQVTEFGGTQNFRPFYSPNFYNQPEPSKSFPCGHCSMGFYFFALALVGKRLNKKWLTDLGFGLALSLGIILGILRIMQGGHFFSDVVFSALLLWLTALSMDYLVWSSDN